MRPATELTSLMGGRLNVEQAAAYLGVSASWLNKKRLMGGGPPFIKIGRRVVYQDRDLEDFLNSRKRRSTSESFSPILSA